MPNFETPLAKFFYQFEPDVEAGTSEGMGWHGLYLGDLGADSPEFVELSPEDQQHLEASEAAILYEAGGSVDVVLFDSVEEAEDLWEEILDDESYGGIEKEGDYAPDDPYQDNPYEDFEDPRKFNKPLGGAEKIVIPKEEDEEI